MKYIQISLVLTLSLFCNYGQSSKILCLMPMPGRSHDIITSSLCKELAARKHDVTAVTAFPSGKKIPNYREISIAELVAKLEESMKSGSEMDIFQFRKMPQWSTILFLFTFGDKINEDFLTHPSVQKLLNSDEEFDLIYTEIFLDEAVIAGFSQRYKCPVVILGAFMANIWGNNLVGNPAPSAYIPDVFLGFDTKMTFLQRVINVIFSTFHEVVYKSYYLPRQDVIMRKYFGQDLPPLTEIIRNVSCVFINHHFSLAYTRPYVPNMIEIGGFHVRPPKQLPKDIQDYLDNSKEGVIFFSLGSNVRSSQMPKDRLEIILNVFSKLKYDVLWKWETDELPGKPKNVKTSKWFPQADILAHPNLKLFITHGGLLSTTESVHRGVPIVGIPIFAEQPLNTRQAELAGFGKKVDFDDMTVDSLHEAILEVVENPKYRENVKKRSALLKDTPLSAMDTAVYWIEYVIRHNGAHHMRSAAQDLSWFSLYLLDVYLALLAVVLLAIYLISYLVKLCCRCCFSKQKAVPKTKKRN